MSSLLLYRALPFTCSTSANLATPDPKEVFSYGAPTAIHLDFGFAVTLDSVFAGYFLPAQNGAYIGEVGTETGIDVGIVQRYVGGAALARVGRRQSSFARFAPASSRYWRVAVYAAVYPVNFGVIAAGLANQPAYGHEWGSGRQPIDMSSVTALRGGGFGIERGARMSAWRFTCGDLTDAETQSLWAMVEEVGESAPVVTVEDPDYTNGLNERLHYGLFDSPEAYERQAIGANRWSFRVREWV